jgi:hypothetical protein
MTLPFIFTSYQLSEGDQVTIPVDLRIVAVIECSTVPAGRGPESTVVVPAVTPA